MNLHVFPCSMHCTYQSVLATVQRCFQLIHCYKPMPRLKFLQSSCMIFQTDNLILFTAKSFPIKMQAKCFFRCVLNNSVPLHSDYVYPILLLSFEGHLVLFWLTKAAWIPVWQQLLLTDICASSHLQELSADQIHYCCNFLLHQYVTQVQTLGLRKVPIGVSVIRPFRKIYR